MMPSTWLSALHVLDTAFPTGAYVHSFGLETLAPNDLEGALQLRLEQSLAHFELVFLLQAYEHDLPDLDELFHAMLLPREAREASSSIGTNLLRAACEFVQDARLEVFLHKGKHHHQPVAFGALATALQMPSDLATTAYAFSAMRAHVSAAQRLGWIGQRQAQQVLHRLKPNVHAAAGQAQRLGLADAGPFTPAWDIASMEHESARARMFAS